MMRSTPDSRASRRSSRSPLLRRLALVLASLVLLLFLVAVASLLSLHHRMREAVAPLDGTLHLPGLHAPVTIRRDAHGVPHIEAENLDDLLAAQGWVTASDRLWQMDMARRLPAGEAAEVLGSALVPHDRMERTLGLRDVADRMVRTLPPDQLDQLQAYARGVNAYIAAGQLPAEFSLLLYKPQPWRPVDTMLIALSMAQMLDERWPAKLKREQLTVRLAAHGFAPLAADLFPTGSWRDHPPVPSKPAISDPQVVPLIPLDPTQVRNQTRRSPQHSPAQATVLPLEALLALPAGACTGCRPGSNEWAVSGAHTASGKPLLSNDMHLEHQLPDIWYESELRAGSFHVAGVTVAGLPFISAGHNDHIAWGFTALGGDTEDLYVEQLNNQDQYRVLGDDGSQHWQPLGHEHEIIRVRGGSDVALDVVRTAHGPLLGPILDDVPLGGGKAGALRATETRPVALHWNIYDTQASGLPLYALNAAADWTSFRAALAHWWAPTLNVAYADDAGHIGYQAVGLIPIRVGGLQSAPILPRLQPPGPPAASSNPEADGIAGAGPDSSIPQQPSATANATDIPAPTAGGLLGEWTGYVPFAALPSVLDPEGGLLATANARITPDGYPYQLTLEWAAPYRNERIWKWLGSHGALTRDDMLRLQTDVFSEVDQEIAERLAYAIDHAAKPTARARAAADLLRSWDGLLTVSSPAAAIVTSTEQAFWPAVLGAKVGDGWRLYDWSESAYAREQMIAHVPAAWLPPAYRTWNDFLAALVDGAIQQAPHDLRKWHYGDIHTIAVVHPLWKLLPGFASGIGPVPQSGDPSTVKQVTGDLGPSQRFTADFSNLDASTENIVMGQSGDPASPFYRDQWTHWYGGTTFALPFSPAAVAQATQHTLHLVP